MTTTPTPTLAPGATIMVRAYGTTYPATVVAVKRTGALVVTFTTKAGAPKTMTVPAPEAATFAGLAATETCYCGKTVVAGVGVPAGTTCPRGCGR